ncbi:MAG: GvpL/GvpF family gas vesicle protein [Chloroflexi bacterium]|nr:GvpL/GvpF family gas vesicle protein [Chloroflexota bacterium]
MSQGKYLYCVIPCPQERVFAGAAPLGGGEVPVHTVPWDGLAAVVSDSPPGGCEATRVQLLAHQRVVERVMAEFTLLPVQFGTVARPPSPLQDLRRLLERKSQELTRLLGEVEGRVELGLKARWRDDKAIWEEILTEQLPLRRLRDSLRDQPPEVVRVEGRVLGERLKQALEEKKAREAADLLDTLRPLAERIRENPPLGDAMVLNAAFLVAKSREPAFDQEVEGLSQALGPRLAFKYVGPVPPYNFVNLVVNWEEL